MKTVDPAKLPEGHLARVGLHRIRAIVAEQIAFTLADIGPERLAWLRRLPLRWTAHDLGVVHSTPDSAWSTVATDAPDDTLVGTYAALATTRVVFGHIHRPFVRRLPSLVVANSGCLSLSYDGDPRASYAIVDEHGIAIRRVEYDVAREASALVSAGIPYATWMAETLTKASYVEPPDA